MAKKFYIGIENKARKMIKGYIGINGKARRIKKIYIGVNNIARLCYEKIKVKVTYLSNLTLSFKSKDIYPEEEYTFPTVTPSNSNRQDFWFYPESTAKKDSSKKYIDYPWCAYADANAEAYNKCKYVQDKLAMHWLSTGKSKGYSKGDLTKCEKEIDHTIQHVYSNGVSCTFKGEGEKTAGSSYTYAEVFTSDGTNIINFIGRGIPLFTAINDIINIFSSSTVQTAFEGTTTLFPGTKIKLITRYNEGLLGIGSGGSACYIKINGTKVAGRGSYTYTIPNNIKTLKVQLGMDTHYDGGESWVINVTTTAA